MILNMQIKQLYIGVAVIAFFIICGLGVSNVLNANVRNLPIVLEPQQQKIIKNYLNNLGWKVSTRPIEMEKIFIPEQFDSVYENYNKIQLEVGFDLSNFKNTQCLRYTYQILNFDVIDVGDQQVRANIILCNNKIIGGDICTVALDGFMIPLCNKKNAIVYFKR